LSYKTIWDFALTLVEKIAYFYFTDNSYVSPYFYVIGIVGADVACSENGGPNPEQQCI